MNCCWKKLSIPLAAVAGTLMLVGCSSISEYVAPSIGVPQQPPTNPDMVEILSAAPKVPREELGQIVLTVQGQPSVQELEKSLRQTAAKLGADAVFVIRDRTHVLPIVYMDPWWGPTGTTQDIRRDIVAVAIKYKAKPAGGSP